MKKIAYFYVFDTMVDWEPGYVIAELHILSFQLGCIDGEPDKFRQSPKQSKDRYKN